MFLKAVSEASLASAAAGRSSVSKPGVAASDDEAGMLRRLRLEAAYKAVSAEIERSILAGDITHGMLLPTEQVLAATGRLHAPVN